VDCPNCRRGNQCVRISGSISLDHIQSPLTKAKQWDSFQGDAGNVGQGRADGTWASRSSAPLKARTGGANSDSFDRSNIPIPPRRLRFGRRGPARDHHGGSRSGTGDKHRSESEQERSWSTLIRSKGREIHRFAGHPREYLGNPTAAIPKTTGHGKDATSVLNCPKATEGHQLDWLNPIPKPCVAGSSPAGGAL